MTLDALSAELVGCRRCPRLVDWREAVADDPPRRFRGETYWAAPVPGFGDPAARLLLVGLAPGAHGANRTGRMFTGDPSGDFLWAALHRAGLANQPTSTSLDDGLELVGARLLSPVRCVPVANRPTAEERDRCRDWFARELDLVPWEVAIALGAFGWSALLREVGAVPTPFAHGTETVSGDGRRLIAAYHPSPLNTRTGRLRPEMMDDVLTKALAGPDRVDPEPS